MLNTTLQHLKCPCGNPLDLIPKDVLRSGTTAEVFEVSSGNLQCQKCKARFPILAGVALLVEDVYGYLMEHVKGIAKVVPDSEIPADYLADFLEAKAEIQIEHIEWDLEAERVNALYLMNHYLHANPEPLELWWQPREGVGSALINSLVREYWDKGPFSQIQTWVAHIAKTGQKSNVVELGCGVAGLHSVLKPHLQSYLGVDSSFASVAIGRHLALGVPYRGSLKVPEDLLQGPVSRDIQFPMAKSYDGHADLIVADMAAPPLRHNEWDIAIALNTIDMLDEPARLPKIQHDLLRKGGIAIQSCPYIWHEGVAQTLRTMLPKDVKESSRAVEWLYEQAGFEIDEKIEHLPWLFFKHLRQMEIYSVHMFAAKRWK